MKRFWIFFISIIFSASLNAQDLKSFAFTNRNNFSSLNEFRHSQTMNKNFIYYYSSHLKKDFLFSTDTPKRKHNMYGNLTSDDTLYNRRYCSLIPAVEILGVNFLTWSIDRYVFDADYARVSPETWKYNMKEGWEWDTDRFGINFIGHPYSGTLFYNSARANGYNFFGSIPFAIGGSLMWEYFGENSKPSYNDLINTPINGIFLGEILYRLSENVLDDQSRGGERFFRELSATVLSPMVGFNRLVQGKMFRVTHKEVYQKEPCNISIFAGIHKVNTNKEFLTGNFNEILNLQVDYGNPFEKRNKKPFDVFRIRLDLSYGQGTDLLNNISGYGNLITKNSKAGAIDLLHGLFQYYDYWDNPTFELGTIGFGEGVISKLKVFKKSFLYTSLHIGVAPFAGSSTRFGPDTLAFRNYNFGGGMEGKFEATFNLSEAAAISFNAYYFWIHTYQGMPGDNFVGILKPKITIRIIKNISVGLEQYVYINDRYTPNRKAIHQIQTEQKIFLLLYLENRKRSGHYE